ncbi:tetratricopeptide repeat protein [Lacihabitans sp. CCS-44]|uniref:tetratricopeptide repeat protein n=1 Tax=Lacihabitans sp. CCS-44 TaxID=2487331 RepID=UPI0020CE0A14|nr:tetratricopeptide repeat protein [Lacihabitans sp. CCS-44]MCP9756990.1 tetratricopeptide repeat protein [Lacihabitans sp. CCS-44]
MKIKFLIIFFGLIAQQISAQNTLSYTQLEAHYNNGIELFEKKAYAAARKELHTYVSLSEKSLNPNKFNIANAEYYSALSSLYSQAKDADIEVERFVVKNHEHPKAKLIFNDLAKSFFNKGDYAGAIKYFEKALDNRQDNLDTYEIRYQLALAHYQLKDFKNALKQFDYVKGTVAPNALNAAYYSAVINFQNENYDLAIIDLKRVENVNPYKTEVPNWIAQILYRQKKYDELLAYAEPIIANPNGRKIDELCLLTAEVHFFENNFEKAAAYYEKFKGFRRGTISDQVTFRHAYSLYKVENYEKAALLFKSLAAANTELGQQSAYYLGIASLRGGDLNSAMAAFDAARKNNFDKSIQEEASYNHIKVLVEKGNNQQATADLQTYIKTYPTGKYIDETNELLSEILFETSNYVSAITYIEGLTRRTPKIDEAYQKLTYNQGVLDFNVEKFESAIGYFNKSLTKPINNKLALQAKFWKAESNYQLEKPGTEELYRELINSSDNILRLKSLYSLGYLFYNQKNYKKAQGYFEEFRTKAKNEVELSQNYEDALVRLGDCFLANKDYAQALKSYDTALQINKTDKDYAMYQKGLTLKFLGRDSESKEVFEKFTKTYSSSRLIDDALFQNAVLEMDKSNYASAVSIFTDLLRKKPNSVLVPQVLLKRALSFSNIQNHDKAISDYKVIINKFGKTEFAEEALLGIRESLNATNRSEEFFEIAEQFKTSNPGGNSVQNLQFDSAKDLFYAEKYDKAIQSFQSYLKAYPTSTSASEANYLLAESYYLLGNKKEALKYYNEIIVSNQVEFLTKSAMRSGSINYDNQNYDDAIQNYLQVAGSTSNQREVVLAQEGLIKSYYFKGNYDKVIEFSTKVIQEGGNTVLGAKNRAMLFKAKAHMQKKENAQAKTEFEAVIALAKDVSGAEAKYFLGDMLNKQKQYDASIKSLQELANDFSDFVYWYERAFLLIADNYLAKDDSFMAKATLNSIIENSENKETIETAKQKLKAIK